MQYLITTRDEKGSLRQVRIAESKKSGLLEFDSVNLLAGWTICMEPIIEE